MTNDHEEKAKIALENGYEEAKTVLEDKDKTEEFLQRLEQKLKVVPVAGGKLSEIPVMASLVRSYLKKEYTEVPIGSIIAMISALTYFVSPADIIPDVVPVLGYVDDAAVAAACWKLVESDVEEYKRWRCNNGRTMDFQ